METLTRAAELLTALRDGELQDSEWPEVDAIITELAAKAETPVVVVVRDPDASNEYRIFGGLVETHDIDLGNMNLADPEQHKEWSESHLAVSDEYERAGRQDVADYIREIVYEG